MIRCLVTRSRLLLWMAGLIPPALLAVPARGAGPASRRQEASGAAEASLPVSTVPESPSGAWLDHVQQGLVKSEYHIRLGPAHYPPDRGTVYQAPNRAHDLRFYFDKRGVDVLDRRREGAPTLLRLELARWGRAGELDTALPGRLRGNGNRLEMELIGSSIPGGVSARRWRGPFRAAPLVF